MVEVGTKVRLRGCFYGGGAIKTELGDALFARDKRSMLTLTPIPTGVWEVFRIEADKVYLTDGVLRVYFSTRGPYRSYIPGVTE